MAEKHESKQGTARAYFPPVLRDRGDVRVLTTGHVGDWPETGDAVVWGSYTPPIEDNPNK